MERLNPDSDMVTTLEVTCHLNGTYDLDIELFKCTSPCPPPTLKYPEIMEHDWSDMTLNLEIEEEVRFKCKDDYQLVSKGAFASGTVYIKAVRSSRLLSALLNLFKLVYGTFGHYNIHRTLNFFHDQPGRNKMYQS